MAPRPPQLPRNLKPEQMLALALLALIVLVVSLVRTGCEGPRVLPTATVEGELLFCTWNVENLFDDIDDPYARTPDKQYDDWFSGDRATRDEKYEHLCRAILGMNDGKGPDILVLVEVESQRAVELLRDRLNRQLPEDRQYQRPVFKPISSGRHIAPAILTRLPARYDRTQLLDGRRRVLEGRIDVDGNELVVLASHWTSRVSDEEGDGRERYADLIYGRYKAIAKKNPAVDLIVCGDFNDTPDDVSVRSHLHARPLVEAQVASDEPLLFNLMVGQDPRKFGTHNYRRKWFIFDQIVISPGLLDDRGWECVVDSVHTVREFTSQPGKDTPWRFGNENDSGPRGYSDHFPVTVRLRLAGAKPSGN